MESLIFDKASNEDDVIRRILTNSLPLKESISELEKVQNMVQNRIQGLASNYHLSIIGHQSSLENLAGQIKQLQKKSETLNQKTAKIGKDLESNLEKMNDGINKLEKIQKASDMVRLLQQFCIKVKKSRTYDQKEIEALMGELQGVNIVSKLINKS